MKIRELQILLNNQPSISGNTFVVGALLVISCLLAFAFLILGIGLFLESWFGYKIFLNWVARQLNLLLDIEQRTTLAVSFGTSALILCVVFCGVIYLCRMILRRNHFMILTEDWLYANITELTKPKNRRSGK